jgi:integrase
MARPRKTQRRHRGEGTIYEKTRRWKTADEKTIWVARTSGLDHLEFSGSTFEEARDKRDEHLRQNGKPLPRAQRPKPITVKAFSELFLENRKTNRRFATYRDYKCTLAHILPHIGDLRLHELSDDHIKAMYRALEAKVSASMRKRVHVALRTMLNYALECREIKASPLATMKQDTPRYKPPSIRPLEDSEIARLLQEERSDRLEGLYSLAVDSGARQGELFALEWPDLDLGRRSIYIQRAAVENEDGVVIEHCKTEKSRRRLEISADTVQALRRRKARAMKEGLGDCRLVFPTESGTVLRKSNFTRKMWEPIRKAAKLSCRFHDLRHTCACLLLKDGIDPKIVQERLGHASIVQTMDTYSAFIPSLQAGAATAMGRVFQRLNRRKTLRLAS